MKNLEIHDNCRAMCEKPNRILNLAKIDRGDRSNRSCRKFKKETILISHFTANRLYFDTVESFSWHFAFSNREPIAEYGFQECTSSAEVLIGVSDEHSSPFSRKRLDTPLN
jgi:hypothetical protein